MGKVIRRMLLIATAIVAVVAILFVSLSGPTLRAALHEWRDGGFPSLSVAIGNTCGVVWTGVAGERNLESSDPATSTDLYGIGSITKTFVAVVVLQLAAEGVLDLIQPATHYARQLQNMGIANADTATLAQLMNHTSGIASWETDQRWIRDARGADLDPRRRWAPTDALAYIRGKPATAAPGVAYRYSNTNYTLLGLVIEAATGRPLTREIEERILIPLGLNSTFLEGYEAIPAERLPRRYHFGTGAFQEAAGVSPHFAESSQGLLDVSASSLAPEWAAGGIVMTADDLAAFALALRDGRLLAPEQLAFMQTWRPAEPGSEVGHGLFRLDRGNGLHTIGHGGAVLGFGAQMEWLEGGDAVIVSLANVGTIHSGETPLDGGAARPFALASLVYLAGVKAIGCLGVPSSR